MNIEIISTEKLLSIETVKQQLQKDLGNKIFWVLSLCQLKQNKRFYVYHIKLSILFEYIKKNYKSKSLSKKITQAKNILSNINTQANQKLFFIVWNYEKIDFDKIWFDWILTNDEYSNIWNIINILERDQNIIEDLLKNIEDWNIEQFKEIMKNYHHMEANNESITKLLAPYEELLTDKEYNYLINFIKN